MDHVFMLRDRKKWMLGKDRERTKVEGQQKNSWSRRWCETVHGSLNEHVIQTQLWSQF